MSTNPPKAAKEEALALNEAHLLRQMVRGFVSNSAAVHDRLVTNLFNFDRRFAGPGGVDKPGRDIDLECGYPRHEYRFAEYKYLFDYVGLANRAVKVFPVECWSVQPSLSETEDARVTRFERKWKDLEDRLHPWTELQKLDVLAGIHQFAILVIGLPGRPEEPPEGVNPDGSQVDGYAGANPWADVAYLQVYAQGNVEIKHRDTDPASPRYGMPTLYTIKVDDPGLTSGTLDRLKDYDLHWTRVLHFADNTEESRAFGVSRIRPVRNQILDCRKVLGADAEGFWQTGFPGYSVETLPNLVEDGEMDTASAEEQWRRYRDELRRVMFMHGTTVKSLAPTVSDPTPHLTQPLQVICATLEVPVRVFLGSESGHLASTQDSQTWNRRLARRQRTVIDAKIIRPFVERLILVGVLPRPRNGRFIVEWRDLNAVSDEVRANIALKKSQAMMQYVAGKCYELMRPHQYMTLVMGYSEDEARAVIDACGGEDKMLATLKAIVATLKPAGGGRVGNAPKASPGRPAGQTP